MLHDKDSVRARLDDDVFASTDLSVALPKYRMPDREHDPRHAYQLVARRAAARRQLAPEPGDVLPDLGRAGGAPADGPDCIDKNMIDKDEYPQTAELEARCVHMLADLWNAPDAANTLGTSTTGSSEAAMLGGMALLWKWRARRQRRREARRQAEPRHRSGPDLLAQVRALLGRRAPRDPDGGRPPAHDPRGGAQAGRREHHRRRADARRDLHLPVRAGGGGRRGPRRAAGETAGSMSRSTSTARAAGSSHRSSTRISSGTSGCRA